MRIIMQKDEPGRHASCPDLPQLYGYGATEREARDMLLREMRSLYADLRDGTPTTDEYAALLPFLHSHFSCGKRIDCKSKKL